MSVEYGSTGFRHHPVPFAVWCHLPDLGSPRLAGGGGAPCRNRSAGLLALTMKPAAEALASCGTGQLDFLCLPRKRQLCTSPVEHDCPNHTHEP